ncbi:MAG: sterol desaturase family protein [Phycisphaerae bacterium]|jgi:sterol desaturase/sphingolipid hydroxylase (fatty acid hydroxylase superfamily)
MNFLILIAAFFTGLVVFHLLEPIAPVIRSYRAGVGRRGYFADVIHVIVNGPVLSGVTDLVVACIALLIPTQLPAISGWPWWLQFGVFFVFNDLARYWLHRWYHASPLLWRIHRVHHTVVEMDALSVFRFHVGEAIIKNGVIFVPFQLLGLDDTVIVAYSSLDIVKGFWHHANLRTYIGPLNYLFNSAELHWWHHSVEARGQLSNYGSVLSIWDWLFGTAYWPRGQWPDRIGVEGMDGFPDDYLSQLVSVKQSDAEIIAAASASSTATPSSPTHAIAPAPIVAADFPTGAPLPGART